MKKKNLPAIFLFSTVAILLIFSWFRSGFIYGGGDVGLQTYNPLRILEIARYIWWEATAPGTPTPQGLTAIPFNLIFSSLQLLGFNPLMLQASLFFLTLLSMGFGMYLLILFLFGKDYRKYAILGGLFYMINPYMMISVWHRFVHSTFFISAGLPFLIIFWLKWIRNNNPLSLLLFLLINLISLYGFGTMAYILTLWLFLFLITIAEIIFPWSGFKKAKKVGIFFCIGFLLWFLTNIWWFLPIFQIAPSFLAEQHSNEQTLATLYTLGQQTVLPYLLQMVNPFYLFSQLDFGTGYLNVFVRIIPWFFVAIIFVGLTRGIYSATWAKWSVIYLLVVILSKGVASPLGYFYVFGMKHFFPLGVLRNPFEKIGVLLPIVSTILLIIGTKIIFDFFKTRINTRLLKAASAVTFFLILAFCWPVFAGQIFGRFNKPVFVEVPKSYEDANLWIKADYSKDVYTNPGKILHLPLTKGESITYNWENGYSGLEPSALLFTAAPSISHGFNLKQVDNSLRALYLAFHNPLVGQDTILRMLQDFNVRYIVLHKDATWEGGEFFEPQQSESILNNLAFLEAPKRFGELLIYKVSDSYFKSRISISNNFDFINPPEEPSLWPYLLSENRTLITDLNKKASDTLIFPKESFTYSEASPSSTLFLINQLIFSPNYDDLWLNPIIGLKKVYRINHEIIGEEINDKLISATKKILKISRSIFSENKQLPISDLKDYENEMKQIFDSNSAVLAYYAQNKTISNIFQVQLYILRVIANKQSSDAVVKIGDDLKKSLIDHQFISSYYKEGQSSPLFDKTVLKFEIPIDSSYELLLTFLNAQDPYLEKYKQITSIIDGQTRIFTGTKKDYIISLGEVFLTEGTHEINLPVLISDNLVSNPTDTRIEGVQSQIGYLENKIDYVAGGDTYQISFIAKLEKGNGFYIQLLQDTDTYNEEGQASYQVNQFINQTPQQDWVEYNFPLPALRATTKSAVVRFLLEPQNSALIKNLKVVRLFDGEILLRKIDNFQKTASLSATVSINHKSPVSFSGQLHIDQPAFLVFSESYHPSWKLTLSKDGSHHLPSAHYLANLYANAYFVEEAGDYNFKLEFEPQKIVEFGLIVAIISYGVLIGYSLVNAFKRKTFKGYEKN
ncbi:MAG: hypothetical protein AAB414_02335 [Patescibacteria group bacterium]